MDRALLARLFTEIGSIGAFAETLDFEQIEQAHPSLVRSIERFDGGQTMALVAGLLTVPAYHANTVRLEMLQHLVQRNALGERTPTSRCLGRWLNKDLQQGRIAMMEDPVEDVFISNIFSGIGNTMIFEGIWESNDHSLQHALNALRPPYFGEVATSLIQECFSLLRLSNGVAERCELARNCAGSGMPGQRIRLPPDAWMQTRSKTVWFSWDEIRGIGVRPESLAGFIHDNTRSKANDGTSSLVRRPLILWNGGVLLALPAAVSVAIRLHILDRVHAAGLLDNFEEALHGAQLNELIGSIKSGFGGEPITIPDMPPPPEWSGMKGQTVVRFDPGRFAHVLFAGDSIRETRVSGLSVPANLLQAGNGTLRDYVERSAEVISNVAGYRGGMTMVVVGGLGRSFAFGVRGVPQGWRVIAVRLADVAMLSRVRGADFARLWKLMDWDRKLSDAGIDLVNVNGELNMIGYLSKNGDRLVPREVKGSHVRLVLGTEFIGHFRTELRAKWDRHAVKRGFDRWVPVERHNADAYFADFGKEPIYSDLDAADAGQLRAVVKTKDRAWWLCCVDREELAWHREIQFRIWDAVLSWLPRIARCASETFYSIPHGSIEVFIGLQTLAAWTSRNVQDLPAEGSPITSIERAPSRIHIRLPLGFLRKFAVAENIAERAIIGAVFEGLSSLCEDELKPREIAKIVDNIVECDDARFFHLAVGRTFRDLVDARRVGKPRWIAEEDVNYSRLGVAHAAFANGWTGAVKGQKECRKFLEKAVDEYWRRLSALLRKLNRRSVVIMALENIEALERDRAKWKLTARALLAVYRNESGVLASASTQEARRTHAGRACRILVEMAVATANVRGGEEMGKGELDAALALIFALLDAATDRDAITFGLTEATVDIFGNGEYECDGKYREAIVNPYIHRRFEEGFREAARGYKEHYREPENGRGDRVARAWPPGFEAAFRSEFGMMPGDLISVLRVLESVGLERQEDVVRVTVDDLRTVLSTAGLETQVIDSVFREFGLRPRKAWEWTPPDFQAKDWYPWRYGRRLSLVMRPLVFLGEASGGKDSVVFAPGVVGDGIQVVLERFLDGRFPTDLVRSSEMGAWIGSTADRLGREFECAVTNELRRLGFSAEARVSMKEFGADETYGDIDVLAWHENSGKVWVIECKRLKAARTVGEIGEQLEAFHGEEMDRLGRHMRRCQWLKKHPRERGRFRSRMPGRKRIVPMLVTSTFVPMQYCATLPISTDNIVAFRDLESWAKQEESGRGRRRLFGRISRIIRGFE